MTWYDFDGPFQIIAPKGAMALDFGTGGGGEGEPPPDPSPVSVSVAAYAFAQRATVFIDGYDLARLGFGLSDTQGAWSAPEVSSDGLTIPGLAGIVLTGDASVSPRTITLSGIIEAGSTTELRSAESKMKALFGTGIHAVRFRDRLDVEFIVRVQTIVIAPIQPSLRATTARVDISLLCHEAYGRDVNPIYLGLSTARTSIPLGTYPSTPIIRVQNANSIVITYRAASGEVMGTIGSTQALTTNEDVLTFDAVNYSRVRLSDAGVISNKIALLTGRFFSCDPLHGDAENSVWPTLELSAGVGECSYRRRW
jgi:hypothetical protein